MIHLTFSNQTEGLLRALGRNLANHWHGDPGRRWEPVQLVLPNPAVKQAVLRHLAEPFKVVAQLETNYLEGFWRRFLPEDLHLLDRAGLLGLILGLLQDPATAAQPELAPVGAYLQGPAQDLKRYQLADELARTWEGYILSRPDWGPAWRRGHTVAPDAPEGLEAWQRTLWTRAFERLRGAKGTWLTLPQLLADRRFEGLPFPDQVHVFGLGPVARTHLEALRRLGDLREVHLYAFSPCREAWDSLPRTGPNLEGEDPFDLAGGGGALLLQRWGRPVREHARLLLEAAGWSCGEDFRDPAEGTLLAAVQRDLGRGPDGPPEPIPPAPDATLAIHACPSPAREADIVANLIWDRILEAPELGFSEVAVLVPEDRKAEYLDHLRRAFEGTRNIPWALADQGPTPLAQAAEAAALLVNLGLTDLNRAEVLRVLSHPALAKAWEDLQLEQRLEGFAEACDRCAVIARLDAGECRESALEGGLWSWDRGLQRAALGRFLGTDGPVAAETLPPAAVPPDQVDLWHLTLALLRDARALASREQTPTAWVATLTATLTAYLAPEGRTAEEAEVRALAAVTKAVGRLGSLELPGVPAPVLGLRAVAAFLDGALRRLLAETPSGLGRGVVVGSHGALRGLPFDTVILMGLGEGGFPGRSTPSPLDLRAHQPRRAGDLARADQDRALVLEAVLAARHRLACTYPSKDPLSGVDLEPSPFLLDLRDALLPGLGTQGWTDLIQHHGVHRDDLSPFPDLGGAGSLPRVHHPGARAEAEALRLGGILRQAAGNRTGLPRDLRTWKLPAGVQADLQARVRAVNPPPPPTPDPAAPRRVRLRDLRTWLECPVQGAARLHLGLGTEDDEDPALVAEDPVETPFLLGHGLKRAVFWRCLAEGTVEEAVDQALHEALEAGRAPAGALAGAEARTFAGVVQAWRDQAPDLREARILRFGPDRSGQAAALPVEGHPALEVQVSVPGQPQPVTVVLEGRTEPLTPGGDTVLLSEHTAPASGKAPGPQDQKALLKAWVDHLVLVAAAAAEGPRRVQVLSVKKGVGRRWQRPLPELTQAQALEQLRAWLAEALAPPTWGTLPLEGVLKVLEKRPLDQADPEALAEWLEERSEEPEPRFSSLYGPLPRLAWGAPVPEWRRVAEGRLGAYLGWCTASVEGDA